MRRLVLAFLVGSAVPAWANCRTDPSVPCFGPVERYSTPSQDAYDRVQEYNTGQSPYRSPADAFDSGAHYGSSHSYGNDNSDDE
jgi:hypothetical protein